MSKFIYSAITTQELDLYPRISGVFTFMEESYKLYGRMRFRGSDYMKVPTPELSELGEESVAEHLFSSTLLWELLAPTLPNLNKYVDQEAIQRMILIHDIGEVAKGDVSAENQLKGKGKNRKVVEEKAFNKLLKELPSKSRSVFNDTSQRYEKAKSDKTNTDITVLTAKVIDMLQGGHYLLTNSIDFSTYKETYQKVMDAGFFPYTSRLLESLKKTDLLAYEEARILIKFYLFLYEKNGAQMVSDGIINGLIKDTDYSPLTKSEIVLFAELDKAYLFMKSIYQLYGRMRFRGAPFMKDPTKDLATIGEESVSEHLFSVTLFWDILHPIIGNVSRSLNVQVVSEMLFIHDIGEIEQGDISAVLQLQGVGKDRATVEQDAFTGLTSILPKKSARSLLRTNQRYETEKNDANTQDKESLMTKIMDTIQGDHYVITHSIDMKTYAPIHSRIIAAKLFPYVRQLEKLLVKENNNLGAKQLDIFIKHHLYQYQKREGTIPWEK